MSDKIREYEETIASLTNTPAMTSQSRTQTVEPNLAHHAYETSDRATSNQVPALLNNSNDDFEYPAAEATSRSRKGVSDISLDENGMICYHGPTSAVHDPPTGSHYSQQTAVPTSIMSSYGSLTGAEESRAIEQLALENAANWAGLPKAMLAELLQLYWSWIAPMFLWVYRPAFMRDLGTGGQYCSQLLLSVICAHSARFRAGNLGDLLISRTRNLLGKEILNPSSIATTQALLQLSARELAFGSISQAWLYSGMAFRMVSDLGLHHNASEIAELGSFTGDDHETRKRLFWSCYVWDKWVLYLGRMPVLVDVPTGNTPSLVDDISENDLWVPYYGDSNTGSNIKGADYPAYKTHAISCFENTCKLAVIINDIIARLYSRRSSTKFDDGPRRLRERLDSWRRQSPGHLRYDPECLPQVCPPPHIVNQNLLYYATIILLHRPFSGSLTHHTICRQASENMESFLRLLEKDFGFTRISYLMVYCVYTGASALIHDVKSGDTIARTRLNTFVRALEGGRSTCPIVQRSLDIITSNLESNKTQELAEPSTTAQILDNFLPAFPRQLPQASFMPESQPPFAPDSDSHLWLDCFPENNNDLSLEEWYIQPPEGIVDGID
ncbi:hypothetical protein LTR84_008568 [Exophiala bonariae]|uniref:Xylanolytic transcriptional activator regulatory domain-containing protein n=1 Tax=Exophiala bonariae TaxID=1690606 RepID=A0AAV9MWL9_9EURO|nr:hypothetical protein LTR84_008568 [Exophiala bonariae]